MLDSDLAEVYGVSTKRLLEQFKRNQNRFPLDFAFILKPQELTILRSQIATSSSHGGRRYLPVVFTEHGAIMLASILNSEVAVEMSVFVVRAFVRMREILATHHQLSAKLYELEEKVTEHDEEIAKLFAAIRSLLEPEKKPEREIGFHVKEQPVRYRIRKRF